MSTAVPDTRIYQAGESLPEEFHDLLLRMLTHHLENTTSPDYAELLGMLWHKCMTLAPTEHHKIALARLMAQEVHHGVITAEILATLGVDHVEHTKRQYLFDLPIETWCDLCMFHCLGDRVGMYVGENWGNVPYEPLRSVAPQLHRDEIGHATLGYHNLKELCQTKEGLAEANDKIKKWWPAALDMFGRSNSSSSELYVKWQIQSASNEELRKQYIRDVRPMLEALGIQVPDDKANRRYL
ncbi:MAG: phenylacetate-CoA oxygenase subunit PaaI [Firmicutes bacterium]|nr:phenylacetate-CoA oxygenase subunit PaaI [Bacillota bacterium]